MLATPSSPNRGHVMAWESGPSMKQRWLTVGVPAQVPEEQMLAPSTPTQTLPSRWHVRRDDGVASEATAEEASAEEWGKISTPADGAPTLVTSSFPQVRRHQRLTGSVFDAAPNGVACCQCPRDPSPSEW